MFIDVHKQFLDHDHVTRQTAETERKMQITYHDGEKEGCGWGKYLALTIMKTLLIMAEVNLMLALRSATFSKELDTLS